MTGPYRSLVWEQSDKPSSGSTELSSPVVYALLLFAVVVLGLNWPILVVTLESMTPIWMAAFRVAGAAGAVAVMAFASRNLLWPPARDLPMILTISVFRLASIMVLVFFALRLVPAGRASVLVWTASLWTVPIAAVFLREHMTARKWTGLLIGLTGVVVLSEVWGNNWREPEVILGTGLLLFGAIINAATSVYVRRHHWTMNPLQALPWQLTAAAIILVVAALAVDGPPNVQWTPQLTLMMLYQSVLASGLAFWAQIVVLRNLSAVSTNLTMMGVPVIGVVSTTLLVDEPLTGSLVVGMILVAAGVVWNLVGQRDPNGFLPDGRRAS